MQSEKGTVASRFTGGEPEECSVTIYYPYEHGLAPRAEEVAAIGETARRENSELAGTRYLGSTALFNAQRETIDVTSQFTPVQLAEVVNISVDAAQKVAVEHGIEFAFGQPDYLLTPKQSAA